MKSVYRLFFTALFLCVVMPVFAAPKVFGIKDLEALQNFCQNYYTLRSSDKKKSQEQLVLYLELAEKLFSSESINQNYPLYARAEALFFLNFIQQSQGYKELLAANTKSQKTADRLASALKTTKLTTPIFADSFFYTLFADFTAEIHLSAEILSKKDDLPLLVYRSLQKTQVFMKAQQSSGGTIDGTIVDQPDVLFGLICQDETLPVFSALVNQLSEAAVPAADQNYLGGLAENAEVPCVYYGLPLRKIPGRFLSEHSKLFYQTWAAMHWSVNLSQKYGIPLDSVFSPAETEWFHLSAGNPLMLFACTDSQLLEIKKQLNVVAQLFSWYGKRIHSIAYPKRSGSNNEKR